jgi:hypothetical protein
VTAIATVTPPTSERAIVEVGLATSEVATAVDPATLSDALLPNPTAVPALAGAVPALATIGNVLLGAGFALGAALLARRFRRSRGDERKQLAWFAYVAVFLAAALAVATVQVSPYSDVAWWFVFTDFGALPVAIAIAITKYRLYDIDRLINRTLVYIPLVGILGDVFAAATVLLQRVFVQLTGSQSDGAVVLSTLVVAGPFTPMRRSLERTVDRAFRPVAADAVATVSAETPMPAGNAASPTALPGMMDLDALLADPRFVARVEDVARGVVSSAQRDAT